MVKNITQYLKESAEQREQYLTNLSYKESAKILKSLLSSKLLSQMHFTNDDNPIALWRQVALKKGISYTERTPTLPIS